jgi:hypothetical protein
MSVRILFDRDGTTAAFYDSVTETAFGPLIHTEGHEDVDVRAEAFLEWATSQSGDIRLLEDGQLESLLCIWNEEHDCLECGHKKHGTKACGARDEDLDETCSCKWDRKAA